MISGSVALGISEGFLALGSVFTGLMFVPLFGNIPTSRLVVRVLGFSGLLFLFFSQCVWYPVFLVALFLLGGCFTGVNVAVLTLFQRSVDPEMKGRFFALVEVLSFALFPISLAAAGVLADRIGVPWCYAVCGIGILLLTVRFARIPGLSSIDTDPPAESVGPMTGENSTA
jgi:MFS family permease